MKLYLIHLDIVRPYDMDLVLTRGFTGSHIIDSSHYSIPRNLRDTTEIYSEQTYRRIHLS